MRRKSLVKLNFILAVIFLVGFIVILVAINPFEANIFQFILFYIVVFGLILSILNLIRIYLKIPFWIVLLISIAVIFVLVLQSFKF
jgi:hypothetical protein